MTDNFTIENSQNNNKKSNELFNPNFYNPFNVKHRRRISQEQLKILDQAFIINPKPNLKTRQKLGEKLYMTPREIQVWFQNKRAKVKQQINRKKKNDIKRESTDGFSDYTPISNMIHTRSQSSTSSNSTLASRSYSDLFPFPVNKSDAQNQSTVIPNNNSNNNQYIVTFNEPNNLHSQQRWNQNGDSVIGKNDIKMITSLPINTAQTIKSQGHSNDPQPYHYYHQWLFNDHQIDPDLMMTANSVNNDPNNAQYITSQEKDPSMILGDWNYMDNFQLDHTRNTDILFQDHMLNSQIEDQGYVADWVQAVSQAQNSTENDKGNNI